MSALTGDRVGLGPLDQIPLGEGRAFDVGGAQVAVFRLRDGGLRAVAAVCPHKGGPLADGQIDARVVVCPLHLNAFDLTTGVSVTPGLASLPTYDVSVDDDGLLLIDPTPGAAGATPDLESP